MANHPSGIIDGLLIGHLIAIRRTDVKLICHSRLCQPVEARGVLLPVDFGPGPEARRISAQTRRQAVEWLDAGHVVIIFPGGGVATAPTPLGRVVADFEWLPFVARLAMRAGVRTLAMFVHGQNARLFQVVSHLSYPLQVAIAEPVEMAGAARDAVVGALREWTYAMAPEGGPVAAGVFQFPSHIRF